MECLSAPLRALAEAVDLLAAQSAVELPGAQALAETAVLLRLVQRLQLVQLQRLADVDTRGLYALEDAPSTGSWLAGQQLELDRSQVALARALRALPLVAEQVADGGLPPCGRPSSSIPRWARSVASWTARTGCWTGSRRNRSCKR